MMRTLLDVRCAVCCTCDRSLNVQNCAVCCTRCTRSSPPSLRPLIPSFSYISDSTKDVYSPTTSEADVCFQGPHLYSIVTVCIAYTVCECHVYSPIFRFGAWPLQGRGQDITFGGRLEPLSSRAQEREPILRSGGKALNGGPGSTAPGGRSGGKAPPP